MYLLFEKLNTLLFFFINNRVQKMWISEICHTYYVFLGVNPKAESFGFHD